MGRLLTKALALIGGPIDEDFGADHIAERQEHLHELRVAKLLRQVVDEQVAALRSGNRATCLRRVRQNNNSLQSPRLTTAFTVTLRVG